MTNFVMMIFGAFLAIFFLICGSKIEPKGLIENILGYLSFFLVMIGLGLLVWGVFL